MRHDFRPHGWPVPNIVRDNVPELLDFHRFPSIFDHRFSMISAWPGGMRGAIESAALAVWQELACQIHNRSPHPQIQICRSLTPLKSPPSTPAHSARPTKKVRPPGFCDFQKTIASAERAETKSCWVELVTDLHRKCKLQDASFMLFMLQLTFYITFFQKCCSCRGGEHNFAKRFHALLIENSTFLTPKRPREEHSL